MTARYREACGGLVRWRIRRDAECEHDIDIDYYARGVGWVSHGAARGSWTASERQAVDEFSDYCCDCSTTQETP